MLARQVQKRLQQDEAEDGLQSKSEVAKQPPRKLARRVATAADKDPSTALRVRDSALFHPTRAMGVVTDGVPFSAVTLGDADFLTVSVGRGFQVFECEKLRLAYIGPRLRENVRCLLCVGEVALTALSPDIVAWHKLTELGRFRGHTSEANVMCTVGSGYLVSSSDNEILVWKLSDIGTEKADAKDTSTCILSPLGKLEVGSGFGVCTAACHMPTYLHKVLLGSSTGTLALWNVRSQQTVHLFKSLSAGAKKGDAISALCQTPNVLDVVAVGFASGRICILNTREDSLIVEFQQAQGRVNTLSFRTGGGAPAHLVSGAPNGSFVVWDLDKRRMHHVHNEAHRGPVLAAHFLPRQPILITTGRDNSIRMWIFDTPDGLPRLLKSRVGCAGPVSKMFWYGNDDKELIVGGRADNGGFVGKVSFIQDQQNKEYSHAAQKKLPGYLSTMNTLPPVIDLAVNEVRHFDWPAIVTAHEQTDAALVWSALHTSLAPVCMRPPLEADRAPVSVVCLSKCGNYCVIGLENGGLHRFNLQSQLYRGPFPKPAEIPEDKPTPKSKQAPAPRAHRGRVCGASITVSGNVLSVSSHPGECTLKVWKLMTHEAVQSVALGGGRPGSPSCLLLRAHGALVAIALDDGTLLVVDLYGGSVVRSFDCGMPVVDACFSPEGRWLAAALRGGGLRVFDLPASRCVDFMTFNRPPVAICFSPSTAFLLIAHAKSSSIQVWANKFLFDPSLSAPLLCPEPTEPIQVDELDDLHFEVTDAKDKKIVKASVVEATPSTSTKPLAPEMLTLSDVPPAKWQATLHLDIIKERNKAIEPPKPLPNAPFFLPTANDGVTPRFVAPMGASEDVEGQEVDSSSQRLRDRRAGVLEAVMPLQELLRKSDFDGALTFLKAQTPSGVHLAIEELGPLAQGDLEELGAGLKFFEHHLGKAHFADELQAFLSLFLQAHGEELASDDALRARCSTLAKRQEKLWNALDVRCQKVRCFLGTLTHTQSQW